MDNLDNLSGRWTAMRDSVDLLLDFFRFLGEHPLVLLTVVLVAGFTLLRGGPHAGRQDSD